MSRRYVVNRSDYDAAKRIRETFTDRPMEGEVDIKWKWPKYLLDVGQSEAVQYTSDKWKKRGDYEDYKHVAEGPQNLYIRPGFLVDYHTSKKLELPHARVDLPKKMPTAIAELAPILGLQFQPYVDEEGDLVLSDKYYAVNIARAYIGGAVRPDTGETFLIVYTKTDLCAIITGDILNVEKDGIVG